MVVAVVLAAVLPFTASARPAQGVGIYLGTAKYKSETDIPGIPLSLSYDSKGSSYGLDVQFPVSDLVSINPFYLTSSETSDVFNEAPLDSADVTNSVLGIQVRLWPTDAFFLGAHVGSYRQSVNFKQYVAEDGSGTGYGLVGGAEVELAQKVRLFIQGQYDSVPAMDVLDGFSDVSMTGLRMHIGIRLVTGN